MPDESKFTRPRDDCPHPEWWTADNGHATEHQVTVLVAAFVTALQPDYVVETGSHHGQTARAIGLALKSNGHGRLDSLEIDPERAEVAREACKGLPVTIHTMDSAEFVPAGPVGFAWLDSLGHLRIAELRRLIPHLMPGAVVGIHDVGPHKELRADVEALGLPTLLLPTPRGVAFVQPC